MRQRGYTEIPLTVLISSSLVRRLATAKKQATRESIMNMIADEARQQLEDGQQYGLLETGVKNYIATYIRGEDYE